MLTHSERILAAAKTIESLLLARKAVHMYPEINRIVDNAVSQFFQETNNLLSFQDVIEFEIAREAIFFEAEEIFKAQQGDAGLVNRLYRDGVRRISFKKGLTRDETLRLLKALASDPDRESLSSDIVSALWKEDFKHIRFKVHDPEIFSEQSSSLSSGAADFHCVDLSSELRRIYDEAAEMPEEPLLTPDTVEFTDEELLSLRSDVDGNQYDRIGKVLAICLELYLLPGSKEFARLEAIMARAMEYAIDNHKLDVLVDFFLNVKKAYLDGQIDSDLKRSLQNIFSFFSSGRFFEKLGSMLDEGFRLDQDTFDKLTQLLAERAVPILIKLLGYLDTISARKTIVNLLVAVGPMNMPALYAALSDDRWYVVRNVVIALRQIGDKQARQYLIEMLEHRDNRVRREAIKAMAELGGNEAADIIRRAMEDTDETVRQFAIGSLVNLDADVAKRLLIDKIKSKKFKNVPYIEKKDYYTALLRYDGEDVVEFLKDLLHKRPFFGRRANDENRAAIAYCVGLTRKVEFLPALERIGDSGGELLRENVNEAIRKLRYGQ